MVFHVTNTGHATPISNGDRGEVTPVKAESAVESREDREALLVRFKAQARQLRALETQEPLDAEGEALAQSIEEAIAFLEDVAGGSRS